MVRLLKCSKIGIFPKGLVHGFGQKIESFPCVFYDTLEKKKLVKTMKTKSLKIGRIGICLWFCSKN